MAIGEWRCGMWRLASYGWLVDVCQVINVSERPWPRQFDGLSCGLSEEKEGRPMG
jgi:hypothetical protein